MATPITLFSQAETSDSHFFRFSDVFAFSMTNFDKIHADFVLYYSPEKGYGVLAEIPLASAYGAFAFFHNFSPEFCGSGLVSFCRMIINDVWS